MIEVIKIFNDGRTEPTEYQDELDFPMATHYETIKVEMDKAGCNTVVVKIDGMTVIYERNNK